MGEWRGRQEQTTYGLFPGQWIQEPMEARRKRGGGSVEDGRRKPAALIRGNFWRRRQRASAAFDDKTRVALAGRGQRVSLRGLRE